MSDIEQEQQKEREAALSAMVLGLGGDLCAGLQELADGGGRALKLTLIAQPGMPDDLMVSFSPASEEDCA